MLVRMSYTEKKLVTIPQFSEFSSRCWVGMSLLPCLSPFLYSLAFGFPLKSLLYTRLLLFATPDRPFPFTIRLDLPTHNTLGSSTHLGYLILITFGLSPSWNNNLVSADSFVNSKCLSFLCVHTSAFSVCLANHLVKAGSVSSLRAAANASGSREGETGLWEGEGR